MAINLVKSNRQIDLVKSNGQINFTKIGVKSNSEYYIPFVDNEGNLSWTPTKEDMPIVTTINIKGKDFTYEDFTTEQLEALRGKDYVITDADYEAIATLVKVESSGYDDTEIRQEIISVTCRVDDLETEVGNSSLLLSLI